LSSLQMLCSSSSLHTSWLMRRAWVVTGSKHGKAAGGTLGPRDLFYWH
jgi:hypothetical protein